MYRLCIFDLDGTLLNTISALTFTTNETLKAFGLSMISREQAKHMVGDGYKKLVERALLAGGDGTLAHYEEALTLYMKNFEKYSMKDVVPYEGIPHLLEYLKEKGVKIAVYSNKPHAQAVDNIETIFGKGYFDVVRGEQEDIPRKPSPDGALLIGRALEILPKDCLYLGDTDTDMRTGLAAGMDTVGVTWGFRDQEELSAFHPRFIVDHPSQIEKIV